jgi:DNA-binding transcriptional ArsR family regulator
MKRDLDLVRLILIRAEEAEDFTLRSSAFAAEGYDERTVARHFELLEEAGLIEVNLLRTETLGALKGQLERLTWDGHEFLDATRNETVWSRTKELVKAKGGGASFEVVKALATQASLSYFGLK